MNASPPSRPRWLARHAALLSVLAVLLFTSYVRLRVADMPLERDEGEYAYAGQLMLQGIPPYTLVYNMKFPGTYGGYSVILAVFGQTPWGIHLGLLLVNAATTLAVFLLGRRLLGGAFPAAVSAATFALLSVDRWTNGVVAHATHFVLLPALVGLLVLVRAIESRRLMSFLASGGCLGLAVLMKQHAAAYVPLAVGLLFWHDRRRRLPLTDTTRRGLALAAGVALPVAGVALVFAAEGAFGRFWFWTFQYAREYVSHVPLSVAWPSLSVAVGHIAHATTPVWLLALAGLVALWVVRWPAWTRVFVTALAGASAAAICPGFLFRPHYFILALPAAGLLCGIAVASASRLLAVALPPAAARGLALALAVAAGATYVVGERRYLFSMSGLELSRAMYEANPFPEAVDVGRYIEAHTAPDERIAVLGSEPEIYFYAHRKSATGYVYTYALSEQQAYTSRMREEFMREVDDARPSYVVLVLVASSWMTNPAGDPAMLAWAGRYARLCYDVVGIADIDAAQTTMVWDADARDYQPRNNNVVYTLHRRTEGPCLVAR